MAEYIERDKRMDIDTLQNWFIDSIDETTSPCWTVEHLKELLDDFIVIPRETPTADVRPERHGRWIEDEKYGIVICSECGEEHAWEDYRASYCEDCGAKMDGKDV
ncbi:MAG: hypothetical protein K2O14_13955 [Oscillospiraceae bacterium]|nr:hypothetical protein [Oscillospiraceae bacterium]